MYFRDLFLSRGCTVVEYHTADRLRERESLLHLGNNSFRIITRIQF